MLSIILIQLEDCFRDWSTVSVFKLYQQKPSPVSKFRNIFNWIRTKDNVQGVFVAVIHLKHTFVIIIHLKQTFFNSVDFHLLICVLDLKVLFLLCPPHISPLPACIDSSLLMGSAYTFVIVIRCVMVESNCITSMWCRKTLKHAVVVTNRTVYWLTQQSLSICEF
jgi:hypothetical protein